MNLPNKLTIFRIILVPIVMIIYLIEPLKNICFLNLEHLSVCNLIILILVVVASITDLLDGKIARKYNLVTDFGKFLDPLADKLMVITTFVILLDESNYYAYAYNIKPIFYWWMLATIIIRELAVTGMRVLAANKNVVIAADIFGKIKTTLQFILLIYLLIGIACVNGTMYNNIYYIIGYILGIVTVLITIISGINYIIKNRSVFKN